MQKKFGKLHSECTERDISHESTGRCSRASGTVRTNGKDRVQSVKKRKHVFEEREHGDGQAKGERERKSPKVSRRDVNPDGLPCCRISFPSSSFLLFRSLHSLPHSRVSR